MDVLVSPAQMQHTALAWRRAGRRIGLVPTMGFLHEGHLSLVSRARAESDRVVLSLFVNPTQFGPSEDLSRYPRDFERDRQLCADAGVEILFAPTPDTVYTPDHAVFVEEPALSQRYCGASRPGHFRGVLTVVAKLFNLVQPEVAVFGQKDAQQARLIRQMGRDLNFPVRILTAPIVREPDGLAMSSRNTYLSAEERRAARCLNEALRLARRLYARGERQATVLRDRLRDAIAQHPLARLDYIAIADQDSFAPVETLMRPAIVLLAVWIGRTRLIDNALLPDNPLCNLPPDGDQEILN